MRCASAFEAQYRWYVERFGFGDEAGLRDFLSGKRTVLEAGTGLGGDAARFARLSNADGRRARPQREHRHGAA